MTNNDDTPVTDFDHVDVGKKNWVWHYTSAHVLPLVVETHSLWLTNVQNLNDSTEVALGHRRMRRVLRSLPHWHPDDPWSSDDIDRLKEFQGEVDGIGFDGSAFVLSCSRRGDDNAQWQRYAGWDGFAIALPEGVHLPVLGQEPPVRPPGYFEEFPLRWLPLAYKKRDQAATAQRGWGRVLGQLREQDSAPRDFEYGSFFRDRAVSEYVEAVAAIKSKGYESEREVRYVVKYPDNPDAVFTRKSNFQDQTDATFVKVTGLKGDTLHLAGQEAQYYQQDPATLPIMAIRCGPHVDFKATEASLRRLLDGQGYGAVSILESKSTQRR